MISYHDIISLCHIMIAYHGPLCHNITYHVLTLHIMSYEVTRCQESQHNVNKCPKMLKNGFDPFKSNHFGFVLYKNTLRNHF